MMDSISEPNNASQIPILFNIYEHDYEDYLQNTENGTQNVLSMIESVLQSCEDELKSQHEDDIRDIGRVSDLYDEIQSLELELITDLFPNSSIDYEFNITMDQHFWEKRVEENIRNFEIASSHIDDVAEDYYKESIQARISEDGAIDALFTKAD